MKPRVLADKFAGFVHAHFPPLSPPLDLDRRCPEHCARGVLDPAAGARDNNPRNEWNGRTTSWASNGTFSISKFSTGGVSGLLARGQMAIVSQLQAEAIPWEHRVVTRAGATEEDLSRYRAALRTAIERSTLRSVARAVGMSPTGLSLFIDGTSPYAPTVERVRAWYFRKAGVDESPPDDVTALLRRIVATLPDPDRGVGNVLGAVERAYEDQGMIAPRWLKAVRARLHPGTRSET